MNNPWAEDVNRHFPKEGIKTANRHMKRCSSSLISRELQIKTTMQHYFIPVRMAKINTITNKRCWQRCGEKGTFLPWWWECKLGQPLWEMVWRLHKKLKIELLYELAIALLGIYPTNTKILIQRGTRTLMFIAKLWKQPKCLPTGEWIKQRRCVCVCVCVCVCMQRHITQP